MRHINGYSHISVAPVESKDRWGQFHESGQRLGSGPVAFARVPAMTNRSVIEAELRATVAEAVGSLRLVSETVGPLDGGAVRRRLAEASRSIEAAVVLAAKLP